MIDSGSSDRSEGSAGAGLSRGCRRAFFVAFGAILCLGLAMWGVQAVLSIPWYALPELDEVVSIRVEWFAYDPNDRSKDIAEGFDVPQEFWPEIYACLTPAEHDSHAAKWQTLGYMTAAKNDGQRVAVYLFYIPKGKGAFSVGPENGGRTYYRGGDSAQLQAVLRRAYDAVKAQDKDDVSEAPDVAQILNEIQPGVALSEYHERLKKHAVRFGYVGLGGNGMTEVYYDFGDGHGASFYVDFSGIVQFVPRYSGEWPDHIRAGEVPTGVKQAMSKTRTE